ncbi:hypothetical protein TRICI_001667 [Trichomonascus ciferrii]|uniref:RNA helicase n=1 Tax=Trichomonascus ciferrii TaxID=44093 RepID=A0A642VA78_9ASCO|nr:hypothetical protein TRICI_001667 [Trichomonascus ciferrii]
MERLKEWKEKKKRESSNDVKLDESDTDSKTSQTVASSDSASTSKGISIMGSVAATRRGSMAPPSRNPLSLGDSDEKFDDDERGQPRQEAVKGTPNNSGGNDDDEEDPLDAYMATLNQEKEGGGAPALPLRVMDDSDDDDENYGQEEETNPEEYMAMMEKKKKKDIPVVDHSKINYEWFQKKFHVEPQEVADMTDEEVDQLRLMLDGIKVRGVDCPKPVTRWPQFGLNAPTMEVIRSLEYEKPTSIQCQAIPAIMSGRDVIGVAKTGSGKTMAFLLPLFRQIKAQRPLENFEGPMALVMTPTRELAVQIRRECKPFLSALNLRAVCAYGGSPIKEQIADLKRGAEIIVCTPGRMIDLLTANSGRVTNLQRVTYLVLDEADRMFDMGFEPQVMKIVNNVRPDRQTVLFSATFPRQMEALAKKILTKPVEIVVGARSTVGPEITQVVEVRDASTKFLRILEILGEFYNTSEDSRALIFVDRQASADNLLKDLLNRGYLCMSIHGGKDQIDRDSTISDFKKGAFSLLIATSVAARGLDVKQLKLVINYDAPNHMEDYVHRVGRTGRAGNTGTAVTFLSPDEEQQAVGISKALKMSKQMVPPDVQEMADRFMTKVKAGSERIGSGFRGRGLEQLDEARNTARKRERKAYGGEDEAGEESEEETMTDKDKSQDSQNTIAAKYGISTTPVVQQGYHQQSTLRKGVQMGAAPDNHGPDAAAFHATLEINDFPQRARWAVTNNANITKITEANGTSITTKGIFYPPGKTPQEGEEPKLYILIEGQSEVSVASAHKALVNLVMSGIEATAVSDSRAGPSGRYTVT